MRVYPSDTRILAIDWSGALLHAERRIWLAEAQAPRDLVRLEAGRSRQALTNHLLEYLQEHPSTVIGLDFAFSFPRWFLAEHGISSGPDLWAYVEQHGETWLATCQTPFWGRGPRPRPTLSVHFRDCELALRANGVMPKSVFQVGGAGAVGTGSIRGMPLLLRLHSAGAHVWPFDPPGLPLVLEIYPRLLTGRVVKSSAPARAAFLAEHFPSLAQGFIEAAIGSEDAFDACVSALRMVETPFLCPELPVDADPLEGGIWTPAALR